MVIVVNIHNQRCDIPVCRPTIYGNPFTHLVSKAVPVGFKVGTRHEAVAKFAHWFYSEHSRELRQRALREIPDGSKIGCHCAPDECHADIIAGYLNWKRDLKFNGPKARTVLHVKTTSRS